MAVVLFGVLLFVVIFGSLFAAESRASGGTSIAGRASAPPVRCGRRTGRATTATAERRVSRRARILALGAAAALTLGGVAAAVVGGLVGQVLAIAGITLGLGGALLLLFYEVGLSEDRDLARQARRRRRR